ncbi:MAG: hypothetical protein ACFWUE_01040 [Xylanivirga thermophila]|jgi:hypothetical protein|uniref:hypothetical protein n=1 Tax=Xylanivirga thermophila TaxID=2496273 RepID=UPI0039F4A24F
MRYIRVIFIPILIVMLCFSIAALQFAAVSSMTFLKDKFYMDAFQKQQFYTQVRQVSFVITRNTLPYGAEAASLMEEVLDESFVRGQVDNTLKDCMEFFRGETNEIPKLKIDPVKDKMVEVIGQNGFSKAVQKFTKLMLSPLPESILIADITSTRFLWGIRRIFGILERAPLVFLAFLLALFGLIWLISFDIRDAVLWSGSAMMAGAGLDIYIYIIIKGMVQMYGFIDIPPLPPEIIHSLIVELVDSFFLKFNILTSILLVCGYFLVYFVSLIPNKLKLVR